MSDAGAAMLTRAVPVIASMVDHAMREINSLEARIVAAEDDADGLLWQQAEHVVAQLEAGLSQRRLAAEWVNTRTGEAYSEQGPAVDAFVQHFSAVGLVLVRPNTMTPLEAAGE